MRQKIVAGNWKMHKTFEEGLTLARTLVNQVPTTNAQVILAPPFIHLPAIWGIIAARPDFALAAQNSHVAEQGAYTGEVSNSMLKSTGCTHVILGHSERREYNHETNELLARKVDSALAAGLTPLFCCGESLSIRESGAHLEFVATQLRESLYHLSADSIQKLVIAYEPIWAIGTGVTASPAQAQEMHASLRQELARQYGNDLANGLRILYGGSVKANNAQELFSQPDIDGGLVGGASLSVEEFTAIIAAAG